MIAVEGNILCTGCEYLCKMLDFAQKQTSFDFNSNYLSFIWFWQSGFFRGINRVFTSLVTLYTKWLSEIAIKQNDCTSPPYNTLYIVLDEKRSKQCNG